jgi:hypothetical protein
MPAQPSTLDRHGLPIALGDHVRILGITPDPEMDEDDLDMFTDMIGSTCLVERIDDQGNAWVAVWWNGFEGPLLTTVGLSPGQMEKAAG